MNRTLRWTLSFAIAFGVAVPAAAQAPSKEEVKKRLLVMMSGFEKVPSPEEWKAAGPPELVAQALVEVADDVSMAPSRRARAVTGLRYAPVPAAATALERIAKDEKSLPMLRRKAVLGLGSVSQAASLPVLEGLLSSPDPLFRDAVLQGIAEVATPEAVKMVEARLAIEKSESVRKTMERLLPEMKARLKAMPSS
jgi:HEAT repeat protein